MRKVSDVCPAALTPPLIKADGTEVKGCQWWTAVRFRLARATNEAESAMQTGGMPETLHLLLVESDPMVASPILSTLCRHFGGGSTCLNTTLADAFAADVNSLDLVLCDVALSDGSGLDLISELLRRRPDLPIVLITDEQVVDDAMQGIRSGAYDYVVKVGEYPDAIPLIVEKNLTIWQTKRENLRLQQTLTETLNEISVKNRQLEELVAKLEAVAATDPLTRLANRRSFNDSLIRCMAEATRYGNDLACVMIDLDGFKKINDELGHQRGDLMLQQTAQLILANSRTSDIVARYGGDEFVMLLPHTNVDRAVEVAARVGKAFGKAARRMVANTVLHDHCVTMSMGLARVSRTRPISSEQLIAQADHALYRAKQCGRSRIVVFDSPSMTRDQSTEFSTPKPPARSVQFDI